MESTPLLCNEALLLAGLGVNPTTTSMVLAKAVARYTGMNTFHHGFRDVVSERIRTGSVCLLGTRTDALAPMIPEVAHWYHRLYDHGRHAQLFYDHDFAVVRDFLLEKKI